MSIHDFFGGSYNYNMVSFIITVIAIILSVYFYFKSKKIRKPIYITRTINLVRKNIKKIETVDILYNGNKIQNLCISKIALWNDGKETINSKDIATKDPIRIELKHDYEILDAKILYQKNSACDFKAVIDESRTSILITFDFFDFEEGIVMQIAHTGESDSDIQVLGSIKGSERIKRKNTAIFTSYFIQFTLNKIRQKKSTRILASFMIISGIALTLIIPIMNVVTKNQPKPIAEHESPYLSIPFIIAGVIYIWAGIKVAKRQIPKGYDIFNSEF